MNNGKLNGDVEVILPDERYLVGKVNWERKVVNDVINGNIQTSLEYRKNKNTPGRKISWTGQVKNTNLKEGIYDGEYHVSVDSGTGHTLNSDLFIVFSKNGDNRQYSFKNKITGSAFENAVESSLVGNCNKGVGKYDARISYGPKSFAALNGQYNLPGDGDRQVSGDVKFELQTPSKILKTVRVTASASAKRPKSESDYWEFNGSAGVFADDDGVRIIMQ